MKRFRWGDVVPGCGQDCAATGPEDEILDQVGVFAAAAHGTITVDPEAGAAARPPLASTA